jgi:DNA polymerase/3'-5' exonuclease PolX
VDLFSSKASEMTDLVDRYINQLKAGGVIEYRLNVKGGPTWGRDNKYAVHSETGIPVDFFATTADKWWNSLVVRTGGKKTNIEIARLAQAKGWSLEAYGSGFRKLDGTDHFQTTCEADTFAFVGLPLLSPPQRP